MKEASKSSITVGTRLSMHKGDRPPGALRVDVSGDKIDVSLSIFQLSEILGASNVQRCVRLCCFGLGVEMACVAKTLLDDEMARLEGANRSESFAATFRSVIDRIPPSSHIPESSLQVSM